MRRYIIEKSNISRRKMSQHQESLLRRKRLLPLYSGDMEGWHSRILGSPGRTFSAQDLQRINSKDVYFAENSEETTAQSVDDLVTEQMNSEYFDYDNNEIVTNQMVIIAGSILLMIVVIAIILFLRKNAVKDTEDEKQSSSILIYPAAHQQGSTPQFISNEIHFSLPPMKSNSLGDLNDTDRDSDVDIESYLLPTTVHNQRSNSFSCYGLGVIEPSLYRSNLDLDEIQWPEGHIGRLWFSLRYEPSTEKLLVSLLKAKNLPSRTVGTVNSCDPFIKLHLIPDERRFLQSKQKKKTCNPYFDETVVFQVSAKDMYDHILKLIVIDGGRAKRKQELGYVTFPLRELEIGDGSEQQLFKMDLEKEAQEMKSDLGELLVSLVYNENLSRLTATVIEARRLKFIGEKHDAYVRLTLNQHYKTVKEKRTGTVHGPVRDGTAAAAAAATTFSEGFNFKLTASQVDITSLGFHVFQATAGYGRDKLIGKFVLGSYMFARGKALIQWNTAIANPMEQNQQWHILNE